MTNGFRVTWTNNGVATTSSDGDTSPSLHTDWQSTVNLFFSAQKATEGQTFVMTVEPVTLIVQEG